MDSTYFTTRYSPHPGRKRVWRAICEYLKRFISSSDIVADVGAGYGDFINQIHAKTKYAVDTRSEMAEWYTPEVHFIEANPIESLKLPSNTIDTILVSNLLEHLSPQQCSTLFDRFDNCLTASGRIIAIQPNYLYCYRHYWDDFTHVRAFSHVGLRDYLLSRSYKIIALEKRFLPFSFKSSLPKSYYLTRLYLASLWRPWAAQMLIVAQRQCIEIES